MNTPVKIPTTDNTAAQLIAWAGEAQKLVAQLSELTQAADGTVCRASYVEGGMRLHPVSLASLRHCGKWLNEQYEMIALGAFPEGRADG